MKVDMEVIEMVKTLSEFWHEVASICYDSSDYGIIAQVRSQFRTNEINKFVNAFIPGTEILKDGKNGAPVARAKRMMTRAQAATRKSISTACSCSIIPI